MIAPRGSADAPPPAASAASSSSVEGFSLNTSRPVYICNSSSIQSKACMLDVQSEPAAHEEQQLLNGWLLIKYIMTSL